MAKGLYGINTGDIAAQAKRLQDVKGNSEEWFLSFEAPENKTNAGINSALLKNALLTLTHQNSPRVAQLVESNQLPLNAGDLVEVTKLVAWYDGKYDANKAIAWLNKVNTRSNPDLLEFQLRYAVQARDWKSYRQIFERLPTSAQNKSEWLYWYATAANNTKTENSDVRLQSKSIWQNLAKERSFYGFLAADKLQQTYSIYPTPNIQRLAVSTATPSQLAPAIELYRLKKTTQANQDWQYVTQRYSREQWGEAAQLAADIGWYNRAISAFSRANRLDMINSRFPLAFANDFQQQAKTLDLNVGWLLSMARQESTFIPTATSPVGAKGVLQLMPDTARKLAGDLGVPYSPESLDNPSYNIMLGANYLSHLLERFDNNYILATAAYNAGPARVNEWLSIRPIGSDWVQWVATIPYKETRDYVQNILTYSLIYQTRLNISKAKISDYGVKREAH